MGVVNGEPGFVIDEQPARHCSQFDRYPEYTGMVPGTRTIRPIGREASKARRTQQDRTSGSWESGSTDRVGYVHGA